MKRILLALGLLVAAPALFGANVPGVFWRTITTSGTTTESWVTLYGLGRGSLNLSGSFGGGVVTIQAALADGSTPDISGGGFSSDTLGWTFDQGGCINVRVVLTGATSPNLTWQITPEYYRPPTQQSPDCASVRPGG